MPKKGIKEASRDTRWVIAGETASHAEIQTGAMLRIADAQEKMAERWDLLRTQRDSAVRRAERNHHEAEQQRRRASALEGWNTRRMGMVQELIEHLETTYKIHLEAPGTVARDIHARLLQIRKGRK